MRFGIGFRSYGGPGNKGGPPGRGSIRCGRGYGLRSGNMGAGFWGAGREPFVPFIYGWPGAIPLDRSYEVVIWRMGGGCPCLIDMVC